MLKLKKECCQCHTAFTFIQRRHHCRCCFRACCGKCSTGRMWVGKRLPSVVVALHRVAALILHSHPLLLYWLNRDRLFEPRPVPDMGFPDAVRVCDMCASVLEGKEISALTAPLSASGGFSGSDHAGAFPFRCPSPLPCFSRAQRSSI